MPTSNSMRSGGIVSGASPAYNIEEMTYALKTAKAKYLMTVPSSMEVAVPAAKNAGIPADRIFLLEGEDDGYMNVQKLCDIGKSFGDDGQVAPFELADGETNRDECGFLSFSSGTTGLPKAVCSSPFHVMLDKRSLICPGYDRPSQCHRAVYTGATAYVARL